MSQMTTAAYLSLESINKRTTQETGFKTLDISQRKLITGKHKRIEISPGTTPVYSL